MAKKSFKKSKTKKQKLGIYPTYNSFGGSSGRFYDAKLVQWEDFEKRIYELHGKQRVDFLESLFTYPSIPRVRASKPYELPVRERILSQDEQHLVDKKRGYEHLDNYVVQNETNFEERVFGYLYELSSELLYPMFVESLSRPEGRPHRFNISRITDYGDHFLFGDLSQQILFYTFVMTTIESFPDSDEPYKEEDDLLFNFNKRVKREENAVAQIVLRFVRSKVTYYRDVQYQQLLIDKKLTQPSITRSTKNKADERRIDVEIPTSTPIEIFRGVHWESTEEAKDELVGFLTPKYGNIDNDSFFIFDSKNGLKNLYYILMILQRGDFFGPDVKDDGLVEGILIRDESNKIDKCSAEAFRSGKKRLTSTMEKPHRAFEEFLSKFIKQYGFTGRKNVEEMT